MHSEFKGGGTKAIVKQTERGKGGLCSHILRDRAFSEFSIPDAKFPEMHKPQ